MSLSYRAAQRMIERGTADADSQGIAISIAVVDEAGHLVNLARMDGAAFVSPEVAWGKAWTAAAFRAPTGALAENLAPASGFTTALSMMTHGRFTPRQGGVPLPEGGAVGVSGATSEQDEEVARAAAEDGGNH